MAAPLTVLFDFRDPGSWLALAPTFALVDELNIALRCEVLLVAQPRPPVEPGATADRGTWHRWHRSRYQEMDMRRYMESAGLPMQHFDAGGWYQPTEARVAAQGAAWVSATQPASERTYFETVFAKYWNGNLSLDSPADIGALLGTLGGDANGFADFLQNAGPRTLDARQSELHELGCFNVPAYLVGAEVYYGRQHLPLIRRQLLTA